MTEAIGCERAVLDQRAGERAWDREVGREAGLTTDRLPMPESVVRGRAPVGSGRSAGSRITCRTASTRSGCTGQRWCSCTAATRPAPPTILRTPGARRPAAVLHRPHAVQAVQPGGGRHPDVVRSMITLDRFARCATAVASAAQLSASTSPTTATTRPHPRTSPGPQYRSACPGSPRRSLPLSVRRGAGRRGKGWRGWCGLRPPVTGAQGRNRTGGGVRGPGPRCRVGGLTGGRGAVHVRDRLRGFAWQGRTALCRTCLGQQCRTGWAPRAV